MPSQFKWTKKLSAAAVARKERSKHKNMVNHICRKDQDIPPEIGAEEVVICAQPEKTSTATQTVDSESFNSVNNSCQTVRQPMYTVDYFKNNSKSLHFHTGLECYEKFKLVLSTLLPAAYHLKYFHGPIHYPEVPEQFLLVLMKLRQRKTNFELAELFHVHEENVYNIFITWIRFMSLQWHEIDLWPDKKLVKFYAPHDFADKFPNTRVIVDGTECPIKQPKLPLAQQATFSTYKNKNTVKVLVGSSPGGLLSYISPAYGGSASDRSIIEVSDMPQSCSRGDSIMADKGFDIQDLCAPYDVAVNIPTMFKKKNRLSSSTVLKDRKISSKRVHIERLIGLGKTYKILTKPLSCSETQLASDIIFVCFMLCNFRKCIVPSDS